MDPVLEKLNDIEEQLKKQNAIQRRQFLAQKRVLNTEETEEFFEIPKKQIYKLCSLKQIPHSKKNGLWFAREEVENWLLSNPITTEAELDRKAASYLIKNRR